VMQTVFEARNALMHFEQGRALSCSGIRSMISEGDRRSLRARRVRAHIRGCDDCRAFEFAISGRSRGFASLLPVAVLTGGPSGLMGFLGFGRLLRRPAALTVRAAVDGGRSRLQDIALRGLTAPSGIRGAGVTVLLAAGGGVSAIHLANHPGNPRTVAPLAPLVAPHAVRSGHYGRATSSGVVLISANGRRIRSPRLEVTASTKSSCGSARAIPVGGEAACAAVSGAAESHTAPAPPYTPPASAPASPSSATPSVAPQAPSSGRADVTAGVAIGTSGGSTRVQVGVGPARAQVSAGKAGVAVSAAVPVASVAAAVGVTVGSGSTPVTVRMSVSLPGG
jgi:hypothetical protein